MKWISRDPMGEKADTNLYRVNKNNTVNWVDPFGLRCSYSQSSGTFVCTDDNSDVPYYESQWGYAGTGKCRNKPDCQGKVDEGPLPRGLYQMSGDWYKSPNTGKNTMKIVPLPGLNECFTTGRDCTSFRLHGDNKDHDASTGCIVLPPGRIQIKKGEIIEVGR